MNRKLGALAIILTMFLSVTFLLPSVVACHTRFLYVDGVKVFQDGNNPNVNAQTISLEPGESKTYELKLNQRPGCSSTYYNTFLIADKGPGWPQTLKDQNDANIDGVEQVKSGSSVNSFAYYKLDCPANTALGDYTFRVDVDTDDGARNERIVIRVTFKITVTIPNARPAVQVHAPNGGEVIAGSTDVTWTATDEDHDNAALKIDIWYRMGGPGTAWHSLVTEHANSGSYTWDTTDGYYDSKQYEIRVTARDALGKVGEDLSDAYFEVDNQYDNQPPELTIISPVGGEDWFGEQDILWTGTDDLDDPLMMKVDLKFSHDGGNTWRSIALEIANSGDYTWNTSDFPDGENCYVKILCGDSNGQIAEATSPGSFRLHNEGKLDSDDDGYPDSTDAFPFDKNEWDDFDSDGIGDNSDEDDDNDGWKDTVEVDAGTDPFDKNDYPEDNDNDDIPDILDDDDDNDGVPDKEDEFPLDEKESVDTDEDGFGDNEDTDDDGDGVKDEQDAFPMDPDEDQDTDKDGVGDNADEDDDGDGWSDEVEEECECDPKSPSEMPVDEDGDMIADIIDDDDDNDLVCDKEDAFPNDPLEWDDTDEDGIGDNEDTDDDNDGWSDQDEEKYGSEPLDEDDSPPDLDGDMIADEDDDDIDGDGVKNQDDQKPNDPNVGAKPANGGSGSSGSDVSNKGSGSSGMIWIVIAIIAVVVIIGAIIAVIVVVGKAKQKEAIEENDHMAEDERVVPSGR